MAEQDLDRNESATPYKLQKAKERGQTAKSAEVTSAIVFGTVVMYLIWQGPALLQRLFSLSRGLLGHMPTAAGSDGVRVEVLLAMLQTALYAVAPFLFVLLVAAIAANLLQTGPILSADPLTPDFERINPMTGFRRIMSWRTLFDGGKACLKLLVLGAVAIGAVLGLTHQFYGIASLPAQGVVAILIKDLTTIGIQMAAGLFFVALLDLVFTRREFNKKMRMSRRELKDEVKHREGDPRIRARLREMRREMLKRAKSIGNTRSSDVVIVNPTHFAVALAYDELSMPSPKVVAKGAGRMASAIRKIAQSHRIPIVQNPPLARGLFKETDIEQHVPAHRYADVARIIVWILAMKAGNQVRKRQS